MPGNKPKNTLPNIGPITVPTPPITTIAMKVTEKYKPNLSTSTPPIVENINAPAIPA